MKFIGVKTVAALLVIISYTDSAAQTKSVSIIPAPSKVELTRGSFAITSKTKIALDPDNEDTHRIAAFLADKIFIVSGVELKISPFVKGEKNTIVFTLKNENENDSLGNEGYRISATNSNIVVSANKPAGLFYGYQTICQMLPAAVFGKDRVNAITFKIPGVNITDVPRFSWRGMHLDVSRHFVSVEFVKKYIDMMAMHKLNTFHWHLTDDQGWRLEIKKYPKLTEVGAWRKESLVGHYKDQPRKFDGVRHGGYYTQEQAREIVRYAKERFITIVPEIEMPGHATAAIASYPELGVTGKQIEVATYWGIFPDIFNVEEHTFKFLEDVLTEVLDIFPSEYVHIGGDEAIKDQWKASERIQQKIRELGLKDEHELQSYFIQRIEKFVNSKRRKIIGWDEILEGGLAPNATVMSWQGIEGGIAAAKAGHDVIMTPIQSVYFWWYQGDRTTEPLAAGGYIPLQTVYEFEPIPSQLTASEARHVLGAEACAWAEYMEDQAKVEYMVFPRISGISEVVWSMPQNKNWSNFKERMKKQLERYDAYGVNYSKAPYDFDPALAKRQK